MDALLETFNALTNNSVSSALGEYYLKRAVALIKAYTKRNTDFIIEELGSYVIDLALHLQKQASFCGLKSQSYSGVTETYDTTNNIPNKILKGLSSYRHFKFDEVTE